MYFLISPKTHVFSELYSGWYTSANVNYAHLHRKPENLLCTCKLSIILSQRYSNRTVKSINWSIVAFRWMGGTWSISQINMDFCWLLLISKNNLAMFYVLFNKMNNILALEYDMKRNTSYRDLYPHAHLLNGKWADQLKRTFINLYFKECWFNNTVNTPWLYNRALKPVSHSTEHATLL